MDLLRLEYLLTKPHHAIRTAGRERWSIVDCTVSRFKPGVRWRKGSSPEILMGNRRISEGRTVVREYAERHQTSIEAILLAWLLKHPAKIQPVLGTTRPDRLRSCAEAMRVSLTREEWYSLFAAARGAPMP